jgi:hypothetical protein
MRCVYQDTCEQPPSTVSTGIRFTTLPDATPPSFQLPSPSLLSSTSKGPPSQPPTTITALYNPMLGHMSGAYSARVSRDLSLSSRFDFNVYSYESEWTMGAEWWMRRSPSVDPDQPKSGWPPRSINPREDVHGVVKARASTNNVCFNTLDCIALTKYLFAGCFPDVGRTTTEHARQSGCGLRLLQSFKANKGDWAGTFIFQFRC